MKIGVLQEHLSEAIDVTSRVVRAKTLPIIGDLLLETEDGRLKVTGTDLEVAVTVWCGAMVEDEGAVTIPARAAKKLVGLMPNEALTLTGADGSLQVKSEGRVINLEGHDPEDFPPVPDDAQTLFTIDANVLALTLDRTLFAAARESTRPVLQGIHLTLEGEVLRVEAADGFRLSVHELPILSRKGDDALDVIVPFNALRELRRLLSHKPSGSCNVTVGLPTGKVQEIHFGLVGLMPYRVIGSLIQGTFPNLSQLIPEPDNTLTFEVKALTKELLAAAEVAKAGSGTVRLFTDPTAIWVVARAEGLGSFEGRIDASGGTEGKVALDPHYLLDVLGTLHTAFATLGLTKPTSPLLIRPVGDDTEFLYIMMPQSVEW